MGAVGRYRAVIGQVIIGHVALEPGAPDAD
jgi:hypothetical protein